MTNYTIIQNTDITSYLSDKAFRLYTLLQSMCYGDKITCYPSEKYLGVALRCSVRTIQRALKELKQNGLISIRRRGSISNLYTLLQKKTQQTVEKVRESVKRARKTFKTNTIAKETKQNTFNSFKQRNYNWNSLENMLLGRVDYNVEELYSNQT